MNNSRIPALKVSEDGVILNLNELLQVIKNTDVNSLAEEEFKEFENLYQTLANDNNSKNIYSNEEELVDELASFNMRYKLEHEKQRVTTEELLQTIKGNKDDASNLDIVVTKGIENDSGKDISYLTAIVDGKRDVLQITSDDVLKKYLAENADSLNRMTSEELFKNIKQHVFKDLKFEDKNADVVSEPNPSASEEDYLKEMEAKEVAGMINKFDYDPNYRVATDENGERLYLINNDVYKFKTSSDGKRTIYPIVKTTTSVEYTSELNAGEQEQEQLTEEQMIDKAQEEVNEIEKKKKEALNKEAQKVESSFESRPVDHSYTYNNQEYLDINKKLYDGKQMDPESYVEPNLANLTQDELNLFYYDTNELVKKLPDIFEKNIQSENINNAVSYATNMCKYIDQQSKYELDPNEEQILRSYRDSMDKIEQMMNERAVSPDLTPAPITDTYTDDVDVMITNRDAEVKEAEAQAEAKQIEAEIAEKLNPSEEEKPEELLQAKEENKEEIPEQINGGYEDEFVNAESDAPEYDEAAYAHPLPGQNHRTRRLGYLSHGEGTHGVALVLILLEIVAISILAVVFYNMMY